ncbi:MAG: PQQ-binding-like beta-propeller repeat protein, partial [bacterium]|nr:PQQ-binding-like beta-propeller repeat protein [bacterium]
MKTNTCLTLTLILTLTLSPAVPLAAESGSDWPAWNGPNRDLTTLGNGTFHRRGTGDGAERPAFGLERLWSRPLGSGYSGILVVGGRLVTAFSGGESDFVVALAADTGDELWRYRIGEAYKGHDGSNDGPLATPTIYRDVVYGLGARGELFALRLADGREVWRRDAVDELGARPALYGFASAPTIVGGVLVVETG